MKRRAKPLALIAVACVLLLFTGLFVIRYLQDAPTPSPKAKVVIYISESEIELDGKAVSLELLGSELKKLKQDNPALEVYYTTKGQVVGRSTMMDLVGEIAKAGIDYIAILTNPSPSPTPTGQGPIS